MASNFASGLRACGLAVALVLIEAHGAEQKYTPVGATRAQVIERLGEPRRKPLALGNREILYYPTERLVLQDGVVIEVEPVSTEPARKTTPPAPTVAASNPAAAASSGETTPAPTPVPRNAANPPSTPAATTATNTPRAADAAAPASATTEPAAPVASSSPEFEIKSVRSGGSPAPTPKTQPVTPVTPPANTPLATPPADVTPKPTPPASNTPAAVPVNPPSRAAETSAPPPSAASVTPPAEETPPAETSAEASKSGDAKDKKAEAIKKAKLRALQRNARDAELYDEEPPVFTRWSYVIAFVTIGVGVGFLWWRRRQHQIEMAATTVSRTPFVAPAAADTGARFTADIVGRLEWKRFEQLVAAYYAKTGVMAVRTKTGPKSPVHIKISWKGEPRPFAYVQCLSHQEGLIDSAPIQQLVTAIAADDIRRGYVVSTGKFSVNARDLAEEKHLTLLPGDIFLEKLNALPDTARTELMQEIMAGDPVTPSCPKCEAKMLRAPDDPSLWRCANHPDQEIPVRR